MISVIQSLGLMNEEGKIIGQAVPDLEKTDSELNSGGQEGGFADEKKARPKKGDKEEVGMEKRQDRRFGDSLVGLPERPSA